LFPADLGAVPVAQERGVDLHVDQDAVAAPGSHLVERARLVRRLNDVVADISADLDLDAVLDRIARSLTELTGADAGGFVLIEGDRLRLEIGRASCRERAESRRVVSPSLRATVQRSTYRSHRR